MFLENAHRVQSEVCSYIHPLQGIEGEELATDVAWIGPANAQAALLVSSACHGVEGFGGSGIQVAAMSAEHVLDQCHQTGVALVLIHALNPYGFSHLRRFTHENVDLNRNVQDFTRPLPDNDGYRKLHPLLVPDTWPPSPDNEQALMQSIQTLGAAQVQAIVTQGQYTFENGLFYGGHEPTWSHRTFREVLRNASRPSIRSLAWIDLHTGLGLCGVGEKIFSGEGEPAIDLAHQWWGNEVTQIDNGTSASSMLTGTLTGLVTSTLGRRFQTGITVEFGTVPLMAVLQALRAEMWSHNHPNAPREARQAASQGLKNAFFLDDPQWQAAIVNQGLQAIKQGLNGLLSQTLRQTINHQEGTPAP